MKYYSIGRSNEIDVIGFYPQTKRTSKSGFHVDNYNSERQVNPNVFPDFEPNFGLDLNPQAKETDILDSAACLNFGIIISKKLKLILEEYNLPPHRFYSINVFDSSKEYFWLHYITKFEKYIDFEFTEIERFNIVGLKIIEVLKFENNIELVNEKKKSVMDIGKPLRYKKLSIKTDFPNYDLFEVNGAQYFTLISDTLRERFEKEKITGFEFLEFDKIKTTPNNGYN